MAIIGTKSTKTTELLEKFKRTHAECLDHIFKNTLLRDDWKDYELEYKELVEFLVTTDTNPYSFLPKGWEGALSSEEHFCGFLSVLNHAMIDDGEICLVGDTEHRKHPRIKFEDRFDLFTTKSTVVFDSVADFISAIGRYEERQAAIHESNNKWLEGLREQKNV